MAGVGPLTQLAATGPQDYSINRLPYDSSPNWLRYSRFATVAKDMDFPSGLDFGGQGRVTIPPSTADVLRGVFLEVVLPVVGVGWTWRPGVGCRLLRKQKVTLGDVNVCEVDGLFLNLSRQLHSSASENELFETMSGERALDASTSHTLCVPLRLLYATTTNEGVPLIAMTSSRLQLDITLSAVGDLLDGPPLPSPAPSLVSCRLLLDLAYLERVEKTSFLAVPFTVNPEWVLSQDFATVGVTNNHDSFLLSNMSVSLAFVQGPLKQVMLVFLDDRGDPVDCLDTCTLQVNNTQVGEPQAADKMRFVGAYHSCLSCPRQAVYTLNFGLRTSSRQPSGVLDTDQLSACSLSLTLRPNAPSLLRVYSVAYRKLRFGSNTVSAA